MGDLSSWNVGRVEDMGVVFSECNNLITPGDLSNWNTSSATTMTFMFNLCSNLTTVGDIGSWDTSNVTTMKAMFSGCSSLEEINMSNWNISKVTDTTNIFNECTLLTDVYTPKIGTSNDILLPPARWFNVSDENDNNLYSMFNNTIFNNSVHIRKLVDYGITYDLKGGFETRILVLIME